MSAVLTAFAVVAYYAMLFALVAVAILAVAISCAFVAHLAWHVGQIGWNLA